MTVRRSVSAALVGVAACLVGGGLGLHAEAQVLKLDAATQKRLGITTAPLAAARQAASLRGFARVLDAAPLAVLDADIAAARAASAASQAEAARTRTLNSEDQTVSRRVAEAAAAQFRADGARLQLLRRRLGLEWGSGIAAMADVARGRLIEDLAAGRAALVRIDSAGVAGLSRGAASLDLGEAGHALATILGPARTSDPRLQTTGLLALVRGSVAARLGAGAVLPATIQTRAAGMGVILPREALVRTGGATIAYVRRDAASFERRSVQSAVTGPNGLFVAGGFRPGEAVVVKGAAQLLAAEHPAEEE